MIEEEGIVLALLNQQRAVVLVQKSGACAHCSAAAACGGAEDGQSRQVEVRNPLGARVGDRVRVAVSTRAFLGASFWLYVMPLLALVAGGLLGQLTAGHFGLDAERLSAIMGTLGLIGSFLLLRLVGRRLAGNDHIPCIIAVLDKD